MEKIDMAANILAEPVIVNYSYTVHRGDELTIVNENVTLQNGFNTSIDLVVHPDASAVVPLTVEEQMVLIRQYRHPHRDFIWEIPSGTSKYSEPPVCCAKRELEEETGYLARYWVSMGNIMPLPELAALKIHLFFAYDLTPTKQHLNGDEVIDVKHFDLVTIQEMINNGSIIDSKTICGFFKAKQCLQDKPFIEDNTV
jgi:ADP-ribose pyrophosphatase